MLYDESKKLALNMFLVVNEPEEQEFSLKKSKHQQIVVLFFDPKDVKLFSKLRILNFDFLKFQKF
jgi:hypothetical protein